MNRPLALQFESNVNYDLGKTQLPVVVVGCLFESNVNYDLGKTALARPGWSLCLRAM